jgi:alpha-glucosidase (family GH31 glycosyl hydrolase)
LGHFPTESDITGVQAPAEVRPLRRRDRKQLWAESAPLSWTGSATTQSLTRTGSEQFVGGGEQNGRYSHRDQTIKIFADDNWNDGGAPNSQPFYASTACYGVLRNTFAPGSYTFTDPVETTHDERWFDATYVVGSNLKDVISGYTDLVGKPFCRRSTAWKPATRTATCTTPTAASATRWTR